MPENFPRGAGALAASFRRSALVLPLAALLCWALPAGTLRAQGLSVTGYSPTHATSGSTVGLTGSGFGAPEEHFAYVLGPPGAGAQLELVAASATAFKAVLGLSAVPFAGPVCLWRGRRHVLPGALIAGESGAFLVRAEIFVPQAAAVAPKSFGVDSSSPETRFATIEGTDVVIEVDQGPLPANPNWIDLVVMIDGGGRGSGTDPGVAVPLESGAALPARAFRLSLENIDPAAAADAGALARDLAQVLRSTFGALGLVASAEGAAVRLSWSRLDEVQSAFAVLDLRY